MAGDPLTGKDFVVHEQITTWEQALGILRENREQLLASIDRFSRSSDPREILAAGLSSSLVLTEVMIAMVQSDITMPK